MFWKVYSIQTGQTIKSGLKSEDQARSWLESHRPGREENYIVEEMDDDECEELKLNADDDSEHDATEESEEEEDFEKGRYTYSTDDDDSSDEEEDGMMHEVEDDD